MAPPVGIMTPHHGATRRREQEPSTPSIENLFQFLRHNFLNARVCDTYEDIVEACCWAWNSLLNIEGKLKSITTRAWTKTVNS